MPVFRANARKVWRLGRGSARIGGPPAPIEQKLAPELVPQAVHRHDMRRLSRPVLDLLSQLGDVHVHGPREGHVVVTPDGIEQTLARKHLTFMAAASREYSW